MVLGFPIRWVHIDALGLIFVYALIVFTWLGNLYALHSKSRLTAFAAAAYAGSSVGAVLAGDFLSLFFFWELMAVFSAILIWNPARSRSLGALLRYAAVHLIGGLFFFSAVIFIQLQGGASLSELAEDSPARWMLLAAFLVNAAIPPFHAWLPDAYPEGTPEGSVFLSGYTTKVAVYAFARCFAGSDILIGLGATAAVYGVVYALMENDMRKLLAYHIICQVGYMLCGIGLGTEQGINAASAHAVGNILFKGLLFMATGAILHRCGTAKLSDLGGLGKQMRLLLGLYLAGALAISGMPGLNGYISKGMLLQALAQQHETLIEWVLLAAAAGTFFSIGLKLAYFAFWGTASEKKKAPGTEPVPVNMYAAMILTTALCAAAGLFPDFFYGLLPFPVDFDAFQINSILGSLQLLAGTGVTFAVAGKLLKVKPELNLDIDWFYRKGAGWILTRVCRPLGEFHMQVQSRWTAMIEEMNGVLDPVRFWKAFNPMEFPLLFFTAGFLLVTVIFLAGR
ncbi:MAG: hypothetical protein A2Z83_00795 [Omnitrophica bacterium GWA2_52_8]|nr:MAG: hypothetical protein A2Z83_00795 [Omnitrophica bacterium GWA2_52_8]